MGKANKGAVVVRGVKGRLRLVWPLGLLNKANRAIADRQWVTALCPTLARAFAIAQGWGCTTQLDPDIEVADGNR